MVTKLTVAAERALRETAERDRRSLFPSKVILVLLDTIAALRARRRTGRKPKVVTLPIQCERQGLTCRGCPLAGTGDCARLEEEG